MLQSYVTGRDAVECIETLTTADISGLAKGSGTLTVFTNDKGIITKYSEIIRQGLICCLFIPSYWSDCSFI